MPVKSTKKDDKGSGDSYWQISFLSSVEKKTMENLVHKHGHNYLSENGIIILFSIDLQLKIHLSISL